MTSPTPLQPTGPSQILPDLLNLGVARIASDGVTVLDHSGNILPAAGKTSATVSRSLTLADIEAVVNCNSGSAIALTIPNDATLFAGVVVNNNAAQSCAAFQAGLGAISFVAGAGVTLNGTPSSISQYGTLGVIRMSPNTWAYL